MDKKSNLLDPLVFAKPDKPVLGLRKVRSAASLQHLSRAHPTPQPPTPSAQADQAEGTEGAAVAVREGVKPKLRFTGSFGSGLFRLQRCQSLVGLLQPPKTPKHSSKLRVFVFRTQLISGQVHVL